MKLILKPPIKTFNQLDFIRFADDEMIGETVGLLEDFFDSFVGEATLPTNLDYGNHWALYAAMERNSRKLVKTLATHSKELGLDLSMDDNRLIRWACVKWLCIHCEDYTC